MSIVNNARQEYLKYKQSQRDLEYRQRDRSKTPTLWATDVGKCPRKAILRVRGQRGEKEELSDLSMDYIDMGVEMEAENSAALKHVYGNKLSTQNELRWEMLSGKPDFTLRLNGKDILIEHKMTSEKHWQDNKTDLPRHEHLGQCSMYMYIYEKLNGYRPEVRIHYKAWGNYAEFTLERLGNGHLKITADINGVLDVFEYKHDFYKDIEELISFYDSPNIPPRLDKSYKCTFKGVPNCPFYNYCWGG